MKRLALLLPLAVLAACVVDGPTAPAVDCPDVIVYMTLDTAEARPDSVLVTDSIVHEPECSDV